MSTYSWQLPAPPVASVPTSSGAGVATKASDLNGLLDLAFDPVTLDLVDADDGGLVETTDSRTAVLWQMECELNSWWGDPEQGSQIAETIRGAEPGDELQLVDRVKSCLQVLVTEGVIFDLSVTLDEDEAGRTAIVINYRDPSTGHPVDIAYIPFNF